MSTTLEMDRLIERQLRNWELSRAQKPTEPEPVDPARVATFLTISREVGCNAEPVVQRLHSQLKWPVFDREILAAMAGNDALRRRLYERLDERDTTWLESMLRALLRGEFPREDFFSQLSETVLAIARQGHAIFVGRGCHLILPARYGLRVRLIEPIEARVRRVAATCAGDRDAGRLEIERQNEQRRHFFRRHFLTDNDDVLGYDLVLNLDRLGPAQVTDTVLAALRAITARK